MKFEGVCIIQESGFGLNSEFLTTAVHMTATVIMMESQQ